MVSKSQKKKKKMTPALPRAREERTTVPPLLYHIMKKTQDELWYYLAMTFPEKYGIPVFVSRSFIIYPGTIDVTILSHIDTQKPVGTIADVEGIMYVREALAITRVEEEIAALQGRKTYVPHKYTRDGETHSRVWDTALGEYISEEAYKKKYPNAVAGSASGYSYGSSYWETKRELEKTVDGMEKCCLGADDRAGVFAALCFTKFKHRPTLVFTTDEEVGCKGARMMVEVLHRLSPSLHEQLGRSKAFLQVDRRNSRDCVFYNDEQHKWRSYVESFGFVRASGSFSDVGVVGAYYKRCGVNLSAGYEHEHSVREVLDISVLFGTIRKLFKLVGALDKSDQVWELKPEPRVYNTYRPPTPAASPRSASKEPETKKEEDEEDDDDDTEDNYIHVLQMPGRIVRDDVLDFMLGERYSIIGGLVALSSLSGHEWFRVASSCFLCGQEYTLVYLGDPGANETLDPVISCIAVGDLVVIEEMDNKGRKTSSVWVDYFDHKQCDETWCRECRIFYKDSKVQ